METPARILGHPAHQILIVFPPGLLASSVAFDGVDDLGGRSERMAEVADWMIGGRLVAGWRSASAAGPTRTPRARFPAAPDVPLSTTP